MNSFDISQQSTIIIENSSTQCYFLGKYINKIVKHGFNMKKSIYGIKKIQYSALINEGTVTVNFIDYDNKEILNDFFKENGKINIIDQDEVYHTNLSILSEEFQFDKKYDKDGNVFWSIEFEVG